MGFRDVLAEALRLNLNGPSETAGCHISLKDLASVVPSSYGNCPEGQGRQSGFQQFALLKQSMSESFERRRRAIGDWTTAVRIRQRETTRSEACEHKTVCHMIAHKIVEHQRIQQFFSGRLLHVGGFSKNACSRIFLDAPKTQTRGRHIAWLGTVWP